jgi:hypothetical protein
MKKKNMDALFFDCEIALAILGYLVVTSTLRNYLEVHVWNVVQVNGKVRYRYRNYYENTLDALRETGHDDIATQLIQYWRNQERHTYAEKRATM